MKTNIKTDLNVSKVFNKLVPVMSLSVALLSIPHAVSAAILTGGATYFYRSSNGTTSPIFLDLGFGPASTGEISYSLDLTNPSSSTFSFDFDTQSVQVELDYLLDFPLLEQIGEDPIELNLSETGSIINQVPDVPIGQAQNITFQALVLGTGIIFSDVLVETENLLTINLVADVEEGGIFNPLSEIDAKIDPIDITTTLTFPNGTTQTSTGIGNSTIGLTPIPEPSSSCFTLLSVGLYLYSRKVRNLR